MKDLADPNLFANHQLEFQEMQKRVLKVNEWNDKLNEIREWQEEQERLKGRHIEDDLGGFHEYEQVHEMSPDERRQLMDSNRKTDYEQKVIETRKILGIKDPNANSSSSFVNNMYGSMAGMGANGYANKNKKKSASSFIARWYTASKLGKELTMLEVDNNRKLLQSKKNNRMSRFSNQKVQITESKEDQDFRMMQEDWSGNLYGYRLSGFSTLSSAILSLLKVPLLGFVPSYFILIPSLVFSVYYANRLKNYKDGPLNKNYLGNYDLIKKAYQDYQKKKQQEQEEKEKEKSNRGPRSRFGRQSYSPRRTPSRGPVNRPIKSYDSDDDDDEESKDLEPKVKEPVSKIPKVVEDSEDTNDKEDVKNESTEEEHEVEDTDLKEKLLFDKDDPDNEYELPRSKMDVNGSMDQIYEFEEDYLKYVFQNRFEFANYHEPKDLLTKVFAPMIVNYNNDYAKTDEIPRDSTIFKSLVYIFGQTYAQIDPKFANANEHEPEYYFFIDHVYSTGLFYKIKIRLPQSISKDKFKKNESVLIDNFKKDNDDIVDVEIEMPNNEGFVKILKIKTVNGSARLPLVSTGDVLRFKGMTADGTNVGVVEKLNKTNDLSMFAGLVNAEYARTLDIADNQNTNIIVNGTSGSGKSASFGSWIISMLIMHSPDELGIICLDGKSSSFWENLKFSPHVLGYFGREDIDKYPIIYKILKDVYTARQNHLNKDIKMKNFYEARKYFKSKEQWEKIMTVPRLIIIGDEQAATLNELKNIDVSRAETNKTKDRKDKLFASFWDTYNNNISSLAVVAREAGMTMVGISQRTDKQSFPRALLAQTSIKFSMKTQIQGDAERMLEGLQCPPMNDLPTGSGFIVANGLNLSQLTTPLFSGNPDLLEEFTRIIGLAWTIIQSCKEDLSKEPEGYWLTQSSKKNISLFKEYNVPVFNVFNRDKIFDETTQILKTGNGIHFAPDAPNGRIHLDILQGRTIVNEPKDVTDTADDTKEDIKEVAQDIEKSNENESDDKDTEEHTMSNENAINLLLSIGRQNKKTVHSNQSNQTEQHSIQSVPVKKKVVSKKIKINNKDELTSNDIKDYFKNNHIHSMKLSELKKVFNANTINTAINQGLLSIDIITDVVSIVE